MGAREGGHAHTIQTVDGRITSTEPSHNRAQIRGSDKTSFHACVVSVIMLGKSVFRIKKAILSVSLCAYTVFIYTYPVAY